ncbi:hypothetical protein F7725_002312 [Dissostichus mawsoni]|uniref:Uncharacterized protein n=1 Tax=Dissostichus mawsoni TaxID=36200 RepID=A0A7J5Y326_DISMA|nr:hypothetical protein F7725_002312 [Dissostichus mawsoni]
MPTNQSSMGGQSFGLAPLPIDPPLQPLSVHMPRQTSLELSRRKDAAKPLSSKVASSASPLRRTTASMVSVLENGNGNETTHSQITTVPDGSDYLPQQLNGINNPNQVLDGSSLKDTSATSSFPKNECKIGFNVYSTGIMQKCMSLQTSQMAKGLATSRRAATGDTLSGSEPLSSACHQDLFIKGLPTLQQTIKMMTVPPYHHRKKKHRRNNNYETEPFCKIKICSQTQNSCTITALNKELRVIGGPPATTNCKPKTVVSIDLNKQAPDSQCPQERSLSTCGRISPAAASPFPNSPTPTVLSANVSATQEQQPSPPNAITAVASSPSGAMMGSVTSQISAIHLTRQASSPLASSPSPTEECPVGETDPSGTVLCSWMELRRSW